MTRLKQDRIKGEKRNCSVSENNNKKRFISKLPHKMKIGLIAGLVLIGSVMPHLGCEGPQPNNCNTDAQPTMADSGVTKQISCQINSIIPASLREGGSLMFGSTTLVDDNGVPVAKVVLGSNSTPCEAIAAAFIAQAISMSTLKSVSLTTTLSGTASCSTSAECSCSVDMSGVYSVIMPDNAPSVSLNVPSPVSSGPLVVLDADAAGINTVISVGNPSSNSVSAQLLAGLNLDWDANPKIIKEVVQGSKIVVAGAESADTASAAEDFVSQLVKVK